MGSEPSIELLVRARQLQNGYAFAIDTRDWELFSKMFSKDVLAVYPRQTYDGLDAWLDDFVPTHAAFGWSRHEMTNHVAGIDEHGAWAACYGFIEWAAAGSPELISTSRALYRDRLREQDGRWVIARRELTLLSSQPLRPISEGTTLLSALEEFGPPSKQ